MSVISLQCPNCNAKLKAKASAVGQSLACPRCANMLVVKDTSAPIEDAPLLKSFESDSLDELLNENSVPDVGEDSEAKGSTSTSGKNRSRKPIHPEDMQSTMPAESVSGFKGLKSEAEPQRSGKKSTTVSKAPANEDADDLASKKLGPANWQSQKAKQRQAILLGVVLGVGILVVGGSLAYYFFNQPPQTAEKQNSDPQENQKPVEPVNENLSDQNQTGEDETENDEQTEPKIEKQPDGNDSSGDESTSPDLDSNVKPQTDNQANGNPAIEGTSVTPVVDDEPETVDPPAKDDAPSKESFEDAINQIFGGDSVFQEQALTGPQLEQTGDVTTLLGQVQVEEKGLQRRRSARYERPAERWVDVNKELGVELAGIKHDSMKPVQLLRLLERLTSVPMWIDGARIQDSTVSLDQAIAMQSIKKSALEILEEQLPKYGLSFELTNLGVRVFPTGTDIHEIKKYSIDGTLVEDLTQRDSTLTPETPSNVPADNANSDNPLGQTEREPSAKPEQDVQLVADPEAVGTVALIKQWIGPDKWQTTEEATGEAESPVRTIRVVGQTIVVEGPHELQTSIQTFLRKLAAAKSGQIVQGFAPRAFDSQAQLNQLIRLDYFSATPLQKLLDGFTKATDVQVLVNWPALISEGWTPDTEVPWIVKNQTGFEALDALAFDMGLAYRIVKPGVVELTSVSAMDDLLDLEVYSISDLLADDQQWPKLRSRLSQVLYMELNQYPSSFVNYYGDWDCVVAKLPQDGQRRLSEYFDKIRELLEK